MHSSNIISHLPTTPSPQSLQPMFELKSFAKINLGLEIMGKRVDGYHNLKTIFQTIDLYDTIEIKENHTGTIHLDGDDPLVEWDRGNTIFKAFDIIGDTFKLHQGFDIFVKKKIPVGSGLGGGSSNAAVILLFLNEYFRLNLQIEDLIDMVVKIGADVPFFLIGGTVMAEGIGERITPLENFEESRVTIVIPAIKVPTALIFSHFNLTTKPIKSKIDTFITSKKLEVLENNLEKTTFELFPEVRMIKKKMRTMGFKLVLMSGSGSAVYGVQGSGANTSEVLHELESDFPGSRVFVTRMLNRQNYLDGIGAWPSGKASVFGADMRRFESSRPSNR
jgi:4-diphosphocytidyl-2-C-methyl-D-erythritol kinase